VVPPASHKLTGVRGTQASDALLLPTCTGLSPPLVTLSNAFQSGAVALVSDPTTPLAPKSNRFGLFPVRSPLLRESRLISSRRATEMFQFARCPPRYLWIQYRVTRHHSGGVAPFGFSGLLARMQLPLNVSPVSASFIGLQRLGIHLVLSLACMCIAPLARARALLAAQAATTLQAPLSLSCPLCSFCPRQN
jgi:hypothetical protein